MKNVNFMGVHQFLGEGVHKELYGELPKKGAWQKNRKDGVFEGSWYLDAYYDLILVHVET